MIRTLIVDDHCVLVAGLKQVLQSEAKDIEVVGHAYTLGETRDFLRYDRPDVILLDIALPDGNGIDYVAELHASWPAVKVVLLTSFCEHAVITRALEANIRGFVLKSALPDEMMKAIRMAANDEQYICIEAAKTLRKRSMEPEMHYTRQERQMMKCLMEGLHTADIAEKMHLGYETIKSYRKNLLHKLNVHTTAELIKKVMEEKIVI